MVRNSALKQIAHDLKIQETDSNFSFKIKDFIHNFVPWENKLYFNHV